MTFDIMKNKENYNKKLDDTVQRILDREKEYLEEQLLKEKRENKSKERLVKALKEDLANLQANLGINQTNIPSSQEKLPTKRKQSAKSIRNQKYL